MGDTSSLDLHPANGGRFILTRQSEEPPEYSVAIYLPEGVRFDAQLRWEGSRAVVDPPIDDEWAQAEALKLARAVRRGAKPELQRWRGR